MNQYNKVANPASEKDCGCDKKKESVFSSADGEQLIKSVEDKINDLNKQSSVQTQPSDSKSNDKTELMIIGAVAIIAIALITKK